MTTEVSDILQKLPTTWTQEEWEKVRQAIAAGDVTVQKNSPSPTPDWWKHRQTPTKRDIPMPTWPDAIGKGYVPVTREWDPELESCAIAQYFRDNPNATSVMMTCHCRRCTPQMSTSM